MRATPIIALTGGIGCGKSFVAQLLLEENIEVYDCDAAAKRIILTLPAIQTQLQQLVGERLFKDGVLRKEMLTTFIQQSEQHKMAVNNIVHPVVAADFLSSGLHWFESAILFESGFYRRLHIDKIIGVTAPPDVRIARIMQRNHISRAQAEAWIASQMAQEEIIAQCDYIIRNDGQADLKQQLRSLLQWI